MEDPLPNEKLEKLRFETEQVNNREIARVPQNIDAAILGKLFAACETLVQWHGETELYTGQHRIGCLQLINYS